MLPLSGIKLSDASVIASSEARIPIHVTVNAMKREVCPNASWLQCNIVGNPTKTSTHQFL